MANFVKTTDGDWANLDHVAFLKRCPISTTHGVPRWQLIAPDGGSLGIIAAHDVAAILGASEPPKPTKSRRTANDDRSAA
jgi:hypothetical protein